VSVTLVHVLITPFTMRTIVQTQDCQCAEAVLMEEKRPKLAISRVAPAHKTKTGKRIKVDDKKNKRKRMN